METTGFSPVRGDKTLEVGVVKVNDDHQIVDSYSTLINPLRDISNYDIHGIDAQLVHKAPTYDQIKPTLQDLIHNTTLVAHNASFDFRFLAHELIDNGGTVDGISHFSYPA